MKHSTTTVVLILASLVGLLGNLKAQTGWPNRFYVGSNYVRCDFDPLAGLRAKYVQAVETTTNRYWAWITPERQWDILPAHRFIQIDSLGLNLVEITIDSRHLICTPDPPAPRILPNPGNVASELNEHITSRVSSGAAELDLCITDFPTLEKSAAERLMFHVESTTDFGSGTNYSSTEDPSFADFPVKHLKQDKQLGFIQGSTQNCIVMDGVGHVSSLTDTRKNELSVCRRYIQPWPSGNYDSSAGKYHLSIILRAPLPLQPTDENPVLLVKLYGQNPQYPGQPDSLVFPVPGNVFRSGGNHIESVIEHHLGLVELRLDSVNTANPRVFSLFDWSQNPNGLPMNDSDSLNMNPKNVTQDEVDNGLLDPLDIAIEYVSGASGTVNVDAVCLSTPGAYALFHPDSTDDIHPLFATEWSETYRRINALLFDTSGSRHEYIRMLTGPEQGLASGAWRASRLINLKIADTTAGAVRLYNPISAWADIENHSTEILDLFPDMVSGWYHYPIHWSLQRPQEPVATYYPEQYHGQGDANLGFTVEKFWRYANHR